MPPLEAKENRIEDAIMTELNKIGVVTPSNWLTTPTVRAGQPPLDALVSQANPYLYLEFLRTEVQDGNSSTASHFAHAVWHLWLVSTDTSSVGAALRKVKNLKADVLRAIFAGENAVITAGASAGVWASTVFEIRPDLAKAGAQVGLFELSADFHLDHATDP